MKSGKVLAALCATALSSFCAVENVGAPLTGLVFDGRIQAIRPIHGIPGAATLGDAIESGTGFEALGFGFGKDYAVGFSAGTGQVTLLRGVRSGQISRSLIGTIHHPAGRSKRTAVRVNGTETSAVLISSDGGTLWVVNGLPDSPSISSPISVKDVIGQLTAVDVDSQGISVLAAFSDGAAGEVDQFGVDGSRRVLLSTPSPSSVVYLNGGADAAVADKLTDQVILLRDVAGAVNPTLAVTGKDGVQGPVSLRVFNDTHLMIASAGSRNIVDFDLSLNVVIGAFALPVAPSRLEPLTDPALFLINEIGTDATYLFSPSRNPFAYFIPPVAPAGHRAPAEGRLR